MDDNRDKIKFIQSYFNNNLTNYRIDNVLDKQILIQNKIFMTEIGLPINCHQIFFKPFPFIAELNLNNIDYYLLGDLGVGFLIMEINNLPIFYLVNSWAEIKVRYVNKDILTFVFFLAKYGEFKDNCLKNHLIVQKDYSRFDTIKYVFRKEYITLKDLFHKIDSEAMESEQGFWRETIYCFSIEEYENYLNDIPNFDENELYKTPDFLKGLE